MNMNINRSFIAMCIFIGMAMVLFAIKRLINHGYRSARWTVGIIQTASHPALDAAREGFIAQLKNNIGSDVDFVVRNGEGSVNALYSIAQHFHARADINAVYAIAT